MAIYLVLFRFTQQGIHNIKESPAWVEAAKKLCEFMGTKMKAFVSAYWALSHPSRELAGITAHSAGTITFIVLLWIWSAGGTSADQAVWQQHTEAGMLASKRKDYAEAVKHYQAAVQEAESFGEDDPRLATSLNNLGALYDDQGRYQEAERLHKRPLAIREKTLGPTHPRVATSLNNLGLLYWSLGRHQEAEPLYKGWGQVSHCTSAAPC